MTKKTRLEAYEALYLGGIDDNKELYEEITLDEEVKMKIFKAELDKIENKEIKEFTMKVLKEAPDYFWLFPYVGEYQEDNIDDKDNKVGGLVCHTKKVASLLDELIYLYNPNPTLHDIAMSAALIHDIFIYGKKANIEDFEVNDFHPLMVRQLIEEKELDSTIPAAIYKGIMECVENHLGRFSFNPEFEAKFGKPEFLLHQADYLAMLDLKQ